MSTPHKDNAHGLAVVTGAGQGLGAAIALELHERFDCLVERFRIKRSKPFVNEHRIELYAARV